MGIVDWVLNVVTTSAAKKDRRRKLDAGIRADLAELAGRLTGLPFLIAYRKGGLTKELIQWVTDHFERYPDGDFGGTEQQALGALRGLGNAQMAEVQQRGLATSSGGFDVKTYETPYVDANIDALQLLSDEMQRAVLEIREDLSLFNQRVESARELLNRTFDSSLSPENHQVVTKNLDETYRRLKGDAMRIVELIDRLSPPSKKKAHDND